MECETTVSTTLGRPILSALVDRRGIQRIPANAMAEGQHFASPREDALDWLVEQAQK